MNHLAREVRSPLAAVEASLAALAAYDDPAMFISLKGRDTVRAEAEALEAAGSVGKPLYGMIFAVKDNIDVAGLPTTAACPDYSYSPEKSAFVVARLENAGAIVLGKTNLDQFATGLVGVRSPYGVPRNAQRADLIPGGSSSGSAVAVATGIVDFALGTDTAGSGRIPAGMNGIVGFKPTLGLLSATGMVPACRTLDTVSIFAREVATAMAAATIAAGYDAVDPYSRPMPGPTPAGMPPTVRVGVPRQSERKFFGDQAAERSFEEDLARFSALGAEIVEVDFEPLHAVARLLYEGPWVAERYAAIKGLIESKPHALHPITLSIISGARDITAISAFEAQYRLMALKRQIAPMLAGLDCLAVPTVPRAYTIAELEADPIALNSNLGSYTNFVNLLDHAAIAVPTGWRSDGLRGSLTLIGRAGSDGHLAGIAAALEAGQRPDLPLRAPADRIEIAVVGAHLSGLPLNGELTALGATFLRNVATVPNYKLFALPGTVPPKPGLLRVAEGSGSSIATEVWAMTPDSFGAFVAKIPAPLGIGTLRLADDTSPKGFVVEAEAVKGARDISEFGGWRAFLARAQQPLVQS